MLKLEHIEKSFGEKQVLRDVSLAIKKGEIAAISGMSGCGKTTLLRIAAGLEKADGGKIFADGKIAVCFAEARLFSSVKVLENITCVMNIKNKKEKEKTARECLYKMRLSSAENLYPEELSSGMAARVSLARAMASGADIYFFDEPFKSLDGEIKKNVMDEFKMFLRDKCCFFISHDMSEILYFATKKYDMKDGDLSEDQTFSKSN